MRCLYIRMNDVIIKRLEMMQVMTLNEQLILEIKELEYLFSIGVYTQYVEDKLQGVFEKLEMCVQFQTKSNTDLVNTMMVVDELDNQFDRLRERYYI